MRFLTIIFELIAAILATFYYKKYKDSTEKLYLHFLWFTLLIDAVLGSFIADFLKQNNNWVYNVFMLISFVFYFNWFYKILKNKLFKRIIIYLSVIFICYALYNFAFESWQYYHKKTFIVGAIINLIATVLFFSELLATKHIIHIKYKLSFWIATGLLLFNVGMIPFMMFSEYLSANQTIYNLVLVSLNAILYTCYSIGFIWNKKEYNQY